MKPYVQMLKPEQAAQYLGGISKSTLAKWRVAGFGPRYVKCGSRVLYDVQDLDSWLKSRRRNNTSQAVSC